MLRLAFHLRFQPFPRLFHYPFHSAFHRAFQHRAVTEAKILRILRKIRKIK
jgi:hypothetical protein